MAVQFQLLAFSRYFVKLSYAVIIHRVDECYVFSFLLVEQELLT